MTVDNKIEMNTLELKFNDLGGESFEELLKTGLPLDGIAKALKFFYATELGNYVNDKNYEGIKELEGILKLYNIIEGKLNNL